MTESLNRLNFGDNSSWLNPVGAKTPAKALAGLGARYPSSGSLRGDAFRRPIEEVYRAVVSIDGWGPELAPEQVAQPPEAYADQPRTCADRPRTGIDQFRPGINQPRSGTDQPRTGSVEDVMRHHSMELEALLQEGEGKETFSFARRSFCESSKCLVPEKSHALETSGALSKRSLQTMAASSRTPGASVTTGPVRSTPCLLSGMASGGPGDRLFPDVTNHRLLEQGKAPSLAPRQEARLGIQSPADRHGSSRNSLSPSRMSASLKTNAEDVPATKCDRRRNAHQGNALRLPLPMSVTSANALECDGASATSLNCGSAMDVEEATSIRSLARSQVKTEEPTKGRETVCNDYDNLTCEPVPLKDGSRGRPTPDDLLKISRKMAGSDFEKRGERDSSRGPRGIRGDDHSLLSSDADLDAARRGRIVFAEPLLERDESVRLSGAEDVISVCCKQPCELGLVRNHSATGDHGCPAEKNLVMSVEKVSQQDGRRELAGTFDQRECAPTKPSAALVLVDCPPRVVVSGDPQRVVVTGELPRDVVSGDPPRIVVTGEPPRVVVTGEPPRVVFTDDPLRVVSGGRSVEEIMREHSLILQRLQDGADDIAGSADVEFRPCSSSLDHGGRPPRLGQPSLDRDKFPVLSEADALNLAPSLTMSFNDRHAFQPPRTVGDGSRNRDRSYLRDALSTLPTTVEDVIASRSYPVVLRPALQHNSKQNLTSCGIPRPVCAGSNSLAMSSNSQCDVHSTSSVQLCTCERLERAADHVTPVCTVHCKTPSVAESDAVTRKRRGSEENQARSTLQLRMGPKGLYLALTEEERRARYSDLPSACLLQPGSERVWDPDDSVRTSSSPGSDLAPVDGNRESVWPTYCSATADKLDSAASVDSGVTQESRMKMAIDACDSILRVCHPSGRARSSTGLPWTAEEAMMQQALALRQLVTDGPVKALSPATLTTGFALSDNQSKFDFTHHSFGPEEAQADCDPGSCYPSLRDPERTALLDRAPNTSASVEPGFKKNGHQNQAGTQGDALFNLSKLPRPADKSGSGVATPKGQTFDHERRTSAFALAESINGTVEGANSARAAAALSYSEQHPSAAGSVSASLSDLSAASVHTVEASGRSVESSSLGEAAFTGVPVCRWLAEGHSGEHRFDTLERQKRLTSFWDYINADAPLSPEPEPSENAGGSSVPVHVENGTRKKSILNRKLIRQQQSFKRCLSDLDDTMITLRRWYRQRTQQGLALGGSPTLDSLTEADYAKLRGELVQIEASYHQSLRRQLHTLIRNRSQDPTVRGCVYCLYAFYEKQKRDADDKAHQIRKTLEEQESLQRRLHVQKQQCEEDSRWLEQEEVKAFNDPLPVRDPRSPSSKAGLHESGTTSDSEQLAFDMFQDDYAKDLLERKLMKQYRNSPLRRSIPLWGYERKHKLNEETQSEKLPSQREMVAPASSAQMTMPLPDVITDSGGRSSPRLQPVAQPTAVTQQVVRQRASPSPVESATGVVSTRKLSVATANVEPPGRVDKNDSGVSPRYGRENSVQAPTLLNGGQAESAAQPSRSSSAPQTVTSGGSVAARSASVSQPKKADGQDAVYARTTSVVKSVIELNTGVQHAQPEEFVDLVKVVGLNLRDLLSEVDKEIQLLPPAVQKEVEMAHKVLSADMAELISKMKLAQKYAHTTLDQDNRRNMLAAAHALAIDAKNLYDSFTKAKEAALGMSATE